MSWIWEKWNQKWKTGQKRAKKSPFSDKDLQLGSYNGFLQLLSISQQFSIDIFLKYIHRPTNRGIICVVLTDDHGSSSNWKMSAPDKNIWKNAFLGPFLQKRIKILPKMLSRGSFHPKYVFYSIKCFTFWKSLAKFRLRSLYFSRIKNLYTKRHKNTEIS